MYAIALDGKNGVAVDNIPIRGSSGVEFVKMDSALFAENIKAMNVKAVIFNLAATQCLTSKVKKNSSGMRHI